MADELELIEIEMLESRIQRLTTDNQHFTEENERLRSTVSENERLRSTVSDLQEQLETLRIEAEESKKTSETLMNENLLLKSRLSVSSKQFTDLKETQNRIIIDRIAMSRDLEAKKEEMEKMEGRIDRMMEDNTLIILSLITRQSDLEMDLEKQTEIIKEFFKKSLEMVREMVRMMEKEDEEEDGVDFVVRGFRMDSAMEMMVQSLDLEMDGVRKAFRSIVASMKREIELLAGKEA